MITIQASEFKAKCLALMDDVARTGTSLVITKNGKPVAELKPYRPPRAKSLLGLTKSQGTVLGDLTLPLDIEWDALK